MKILKDIFEKIISDKQIYNLKSNEEIYNLCLNYGYVGTYSDFESESSSLLDSLSQEKKLNDEDMEKVSGGSSKNLLKKGAALSLSLLPFSSPSMEAMQNTRTHSVHQSSVKIVASKAKEVAKKYGIPIGILTGASAAGLCLFYMSLSSENKKYANLKRDIKHVNSDTNVKSHNEYSNSDTSVMHDSEYSETDFNLEDENDTIWEKLNSELSYSKNHENLLAKVIWDIRNDPSILDRVSQKFDIKEKADAGIFNPSCGLAVIRDCANSVPYVSLEELEDRLPTTNFSFHTSRSDTIILGGTLVLSRLCSILPYILAEQYSSEVDVSDFCEWINSLPAVRVSSTENLDNISNFIDGLLSSNQEDKMLQIKTLGLFLDICSRNGGSNNHYFMKCLSLMIRLSLGEISANNALIIYRDYIRESLSNTSSATKTASVNSRACELLKRMCTPGDGDAVVNARIAYDDERNVRGYGGYRNNYRNIFFDDIVRRFGGFSENRPLDYFASKIVPCDIQVKNSRDIFNSEYKENTYFHLQGSLERFMESEYLLKCNQQHRIPCTSSQIGNEIQNLRNLSDLIEYIRNFSSRYNDDYELYLLLSSLTHKSGSKCILNRDITNDPEGINAQIVGLFGLDWQQSLYLLDIIFAPSIEKFWFSDNSNEDIINNIVHELIKFSKYVQDPSNLTMESSNFKRIKEALHTENLDELQQESKAELLNILGIDNFNDDNQLLEAIHTVKLIDFEKLMCCTFEIITPAENGELQRFASEDYFDSTTIAPDAQFDGFGKRNWISNRESNHGSHHAHYFNTVSSANISPQLFRDLIKAELKVYDAVSNVPSNDFYELQNPSNSLDNLISADEVDRVFELDCKGYYSHGRPQEAYNILDKWFPKERNTKNTTVADFLISRGLHNKLASGGGPTNFSNSIVFKAIALLKKMMREVELEDYDHILELQSKDKLTDKQKIMVDLRERLGIYFSTTENVCETEQNDLMSQWIFALGCAKSGLDGLDSSDTISFKESFMSNLSYEMRKEALEKMVSNDRAAVSSIFGPEVRVQLMENFSDCFNVEKPVYQSNYAGGAKRSDCGNAEWVVKSMTNRARAENSSKYLTIGSAALKAIEMLDRNDTRFTQASHIICNEVKNVKYKFDDLVKILDDKSLLKVAKDTGLYNDNLTYRDRFTQLLDYINQNEDNFDDDEFGDVLAIKQWIEGNGDDLSINELNDILFANTSLGTDVYELELGKFSMDNSNIFACIMLPLYLVNNGFYTQG